MKENTKTLIDFANHFSLNGQKITLAEIGKISVAMPLVPSWYWELLSSTELAGSSATIPVNLRGSNHQLFWLSPSQMLESATGLIPGIHVYGGGFIPFADCGTGSGDPYFVRFESNQNLIVQIYHDIPGPLDLSDDRQCDVLTESFEQLFGLTLNSREI